MTIIGKKTKFVFMAITAACAGFSLLAGESGAAMPVPQKSPQQQTSSKAKPKSAPKPKAAAAAQEKDAAAKPRPRPKPQVADVGSDEQALPAKDVDEGEALPDYPPGARIATGEMKTYAIGEEDTFLDIARHFGLGYVELRAANPGVDPWAPLPGESIVIPSFRLLPRAPQQGIVVNLGEMRLYYFRGGNAPPLSFALGIGREGLETPTGETHIVRKMAGPSWYPTERMRKEKTWLPAAVPAGPSNPLGTHALYLGFPEVLIHGSNKPWGIGRRVSSGCMRMYPEDIVSMFGMVPVGTKVTIVNQPVKLGWLDDGLYLEANPSMSQSNEIEIGGAHTVKPLDNRLKKFIAAAAGDAAGRIDWSTVNRVVRERRGYPVLIAPVAKMASENDSRRQQNDYN